MKPIEIDGSTGEGGGQLARNAIALAAVTSQPVKIVNVRGNRPSRGGRGGGLKSQHVTSIEWLAKATCADVRGLEMGSKTLDFRPAQGPGGLRERNIDMRAESPAASALLIFQAVFPFLLFAGNKSREPIELTLSGGTNVAFSLSYEYLDQVLLPTLHHFFGIRVERKLLNRGWSSGSASRGSLWFKIQPIPPGSTLELKGGLDVAVQSQIPAIKSVDITILTPADMHQELEATLGQDLAKVFPAATLNLVLAEDSKHESRIYVLVVAKSETLRWGRDLLYNKKRKGKAIASLCKEVSRSVSRALHDEIRKGDMVDEFLQDQLVIFQALAEGRTSFPRSLSQARDSEHNDKSIGGIEAELEELHVEGELRQDKVKGPLGDPDLDSMHTMTARWVASEILELGLKWYNKGKACDGIGLVSGSGMECP